MFLSPIHMQLHTIIYMDIQCGDLPMPANGNVSCIVLVDQEWVMRETLVVSHVTLVMNYVRNCMVVLREYVTVMAAGVVVMSCAAEVAR